MNQITPYAQRQQEQKHPQELRQTRQRQDGNHLRTGDWINALASIQRPTYIAVEGVKGVGKGSTLSWVYDELTRRQIRYVTLNPTQPLEADHHW